MENKEEVLKKTVKLCRERNILIPTYEQMAHPEKIPKGVVEELKNIGLWDVNSRNLFRITWKNEPVKHGGGFGGVNYIEIPREISGCRARIMMLVGKFFPTGSHKVGATFGPLTSILTTGEFDPTSQKALWPSTGNYCRGGAFNSALLGCKAIAVLPEEMSEERFAWLKNIGAEVHATPGCESSVKEVFDKNAELVKEGKGSIVSLNQFEMFGNPIWHFYVTGKAMDEVWEKEKRDKSRFAAVCLTQGSAGTLGCGMYLKKKFPHIKVVAAEADQCPTLLENGFGDHRIEGIGDKHIPWVLNVRNLDVVAAIDDELCMTSMYLFNHPVGQEYLRKKGVSEEFLKSLELLGISSIANLITAIKTAKYYEMDEDDIVFSLCTDSMEMYQSRMREMKGDYTETRAALDYAMLRAVKIDRMIEMNHYERKRMHNLKYYTWIEQQGKTLAELNEQWFSHTYWDEHVGFGIIDDWDKKIAEFNEATGLVQKYQ